MIAVVAADVIIGSVLALLRDLLISLAVLTINSSKVRNVIAHKVGQP
jgi:hypothetical protein